MRDEFFKKVNLLIPNVDYCSFRFVNKYSNIISVTRGISEPVIVSEDDGVMVTIYNNGGIGYGATCNLTEDGISDAVEKALEWASFSKNKVTHYPNTAILKKHEGDYFTNEKEQWAQISTKDKVDFLKNINQKLKCSPSISNWAASLKYNKIETLFMDSNDSHIRQRISYLLPQMLVSSEYKKQTQTRTFGGHAHARQIGYDFLDDIQFSEKSINLAKEAIELSRASDCPDKKTKIVVSPDQMILQVHESIGHPLELDRILGDERNYAGSSFVKLDMFGKYKYGSELLNITFDPTLPTELATYNFDDDATTASKEFLIKDGVLLRPIGGFFSGQRADINTVACSRASNWNRPTIDRMGNINLEPGTSSFKELISSVEDGIYLETNNSWSIDDQRSKFQFGCERGTLIKDGELTNVVKNPSYRGITQSFWHNLIKVGNNNTRRTLGTANCGKGEPNQSIFVGHSTPACVFKDVEVFGGIK